MNIKSKPYTDKDINLPLCFKCLNTNPLTNIKGDKCSACSHPFIRSPISFEILPLVEFKPDASINDEKAFELIKINELIKPIESNRSGVNAITFDDTSVEDLFNLKLVEWCEYQSSNSDYGVFTVDEKILRNSNESEIFIIDLREHCRSFPVRYYKNRMKDIFITMCKHCYSFFKTEEYENAYLKNKCCPVCQRSDRVNDNEPNSFMRSINS
jgi:intraflagellar transport protein 122